MIYRSYLYSSSSQLYEVGTIITTHIYTDEEYENKDGKLSWLVYEESPKSSSCVNAGMFEDEVVGLWEA